MAKSIKQRTATNNGRRWIIKGTANAVKYSEGKAESIPHRLAKSLVCMELSRLGIEYHTECTLRGNGRADIYVPSLELAIEILSSETITMFFKKAYPVRAIALKADRLDEETAHYLAEGLLHDPESTISIFSYEALKEANKEAEKQ